MRENKRLASGMAVALAAATLMGTSAFAESRHSNGTQIDRGARSEGRIEVRGDRSAGRMESHRGNDSRNGGATYERRSGGDRSNREADRNRSGSYDRSNRNSDRNREADRNRSGSYDRNQNRNRNSEYDRYNSPRNRNDDQSRWHSEPSTQSYRNYGSRGYSSRYNNRQPYYTHGRVSRVSPYHGGFHVWIGGAPYPFFVPLAYWNGNRFRVGLNIGIGGYYNSGGYYDYYDGYRDGYYDSYRSNPGYRGNSAADFRGVVESVDYRRDTFVVRNEATGNYITVVLRDRREGQVRVGDFVAVRGDWMSNGVFRAYDVDWLDDDYDNRR